MRIPRHVTAHLGAGTLFGLVVGILLFQMINRKSEGVTTSLSADIVACQTDADCPGGRCDGNTCQCPGSGQYFSHGSCTQDCMVVGQVYPSCEGGYTDLQACNDAYRQSCWTLDCLSSGCAFGAVPSGVSAYNDEASCMQDYAAQCPQNSQSYCCTAIGNCVLEGQGFTCVSGGGSFSDATCGAGCSPIQPSSSFSTTSSQSSTSSSIYSSASSSQRCCTGNVCGA